MLTGVGKQTEKPVTDPIIIWNQQGAVLGIAGGNTDFVDISLPPHQTRNRGEILSVKIQVKLDSAAHTCDLMLEA